MRRLILALAFAACAWAQQGGPAVSAIGGLTAALPATCFVHEIWIATDATAGANWYLCTATNTWTQQTGSGGSGVTGAAIATAQACQNTNAGGISPWACSTGAGDFMGQVGYTINFSSTHSSAAAQTLNVDGNGSAPIWVPVSGAVPGVITSNAIAACSSGSQCYQYTMVFDGTNWEMQSVGSNFAVLTGTFVTGSLVYGGSNNTLNGVTCTASQYLGGDDTCHSMVFASVNDTNRTFSLGATALLTGLTGLFRISAYTSSNSTVCTAAVSLAWTDKHGSETSIPVAATATAGSGQQIANVVSGNLTYAITLVGTCSGGTGVDTQITAERLQ
jgi:hypothetical protein